MISISAYRRYPQPQWYYRQERERRGPPPSDSAQRPRAEKAPPPPPPPEPRGPAPSENGGFGPLGALLPEGLDSGDLFLAAMLLFLYSESHDEEFLIILIVVGLSIFRKDKGKK